MTVRFTLAFNNGEEDLLEEGKAKFGNKLGTVLKDGLRAALNKPAAADAEPEEDRGEHVADIIDLEFGDIFEMGVKDWVFMMGGNAGTAIRNRLRNVRIKYPKEYCQVENELRRSYPELWR